MESINGFEIVRHLEKRKNNPYVLAKCKECKKEWETALYTLKTKISCGCSSWKQLKPLPEKINGFRTIECHGYSREKARRWATVECKVCKKHYQVDPNQLKYRKHCGCLKKDVIASKYAKTHPQLAQTFRHMKSRCYNKKDQDYYNYGARGITICKDWLEDRNRFCEWSLANGFKNNKRLSIDRIDSDKEYSPDNCRWATAIEQSRNTRRTLLTLELAKQLRKDKKNMTYKQLSNKYNVSKSTVYAVIAYKIWRE